MSSEFINNRIDSAHALIDEGEYENAVALLKRLKTRIHDEDIITKIKEWERTHDEALNERVTSIRASTKHEVDKQNEIHAQVVNYADSYLSYYHGLTLEYDLG